MGTVTVSRQWKDKTITHSVTFEQEGVKIECSLDDFRNAVLLHLSEQGLLSRLVTARIVGTAFDAAVHHMKQSTARV